MKFFGRVFSCLAMAALLQLAPAEAAPQRIVSLNLCSDIYLLMLAKPGTVKAVTFLARDDSLSPVTQKAEGIPVHAGDVEELVRMKPDLVLAHAYSSPLKLAFFEKLGVPIVKTEDPQSFEDIRRNIRLVARAIGQEEKGEEAVRAFNASLEKSTRREVSKKPRVIIYRPRGLAAGEDEPLIKELLSHTGFQNAAGERGAGFGAYMPLEDVLLAAPDYLIVASDALENNSQVRALFDHEALRRYQEIKGTARIAIPSSVWTCGTPFISEAAERLAALRHVREAR